jgi:hypothetical protein
METGKCEPTEVDIAIFETSCGVAGNELERLLDLAIEPGDGHWYRSTTSNCRTNAGKHRREAITDFELTRIPSSLAPQQLSKRG